MNDKEQKQRDRVLRRLRNVDVFFGEKIEAHNESYDFYSGRQWTQAELEQFGYQGREPYVMNEIRPKIDHLIGLDIYTRLDVKAVPREQSDATQSELGTFLIKWAEQVNDIHYVQREVFKDAAIGGAGGAVVRWETADTVDGYPSIEEVSMNELFWDTHAIKPDLSDAKWMARVQYPRKEEVYELYPEHSDKILSASVIPEGGDLNYVKLTHQKLVDRSSGINEDEEYDRTTRLIEYYEKVKEPKYVVYDEVRVEIKEFDDKKESELYLAGLLETYEAQGEELLNSDGTDRVFLVETAVNAIYQYILIGDDLVHAARTDLPAFPFVVGFSHFTKGDYWGIAQDLISPQVMINRSFTQLDYQIGVSSKNSVTVIPQMLRNPDVETFRQEWSKTGNPIFVKNHNAVNRIDNPRVTPELHQNMMFGVSRLTDYVGGKNALGQSDNAAESGRAVQVRSEQGGLGMLPLYDNMKLWRKRVAELVLWYMKNYMPSHAIIRLIGDDEMLQYVQIDDGTLDTLKEIKMDLTVEQAIKSDSVKERQFEQVKELFQVSQSVPPEVMSEILLEFSSIPEQAKEKIRKSITQYKQYLKEKEAAEKESKLKENVMDGLRRKEIREQLERAEELEDSKKDAQKKAKELDNELTDDEKNILALQQEQK